MLLWRPHQGIDGAKPFEQATSASCMSARRQSAKRRGSVNRWSTKDEDDIRMGISKQLETDVAGERLLETLESIVVTGQQL